MYMIESLTKQDEKLNESVRLMNDIMRRKLSLLHEMHSLSVQAYNHISEESVEPLNNIIEAKQALIVEIDHLDRRFLLEFEKLKTDLGLTSMADLRRGESPLLKDLRLNTAEILDILQKLDELDAKLNHGIVKLRDDIAADLARIRRQKQISGAYSNDTPRQNINEQADYTSTPGFDKRN